MHVALLAAGSVGAGVYAPGALAQETELEQIVVTGSRIARTELEAGVPTASFNQDSFANIGAIRTLTLINGRRVPGGTSTSTSVDLNTIPSANIDRIEVITGGASAVYGTDAVAGVVNIITKKNFSGLEFGASYGVTDRGDNQNPGAYIMAGGQLESGGHALLTFQYDDQGRVSCADRYICAEDFFWGSAASKIRGPNAYSAVSPGGQFFAGSVGYTMRNGSILDASGNLMRFSTPIDGYNRNAQRDIAIPTERIMLAAEVDCDVFGRSYFVGAKVKFQ